MTTPDARLQDAGTEVVRTLNRSTSMPTINGQAETKESAVVVGGYDALELDFCGHHQTNAARRRGPYEHYRLVYRYGYDLGADPRYHCADWSNVESEARPRWEERNPGTWEQFKDTIRYAWDKARSQ